MAFTARKNITTTITQDLIAAGDKAGNIKSILFCNTSDTSKTVEVDLHIYRSGSLFYIIKNRFVYPGENFEFDFSGISLDTSATDRDSLRIKCSNVSSTYPMSIIIKS